MTTCGCRLGQVHRCGNVLGAPLGDVYRERVAQHIKWGQQDHPDGTGPDLSLLDDIGALWSDTNNAELADAARDRTNALAGADMLTYAHILLEEVGEALAESDPAALRTELVQVAAVAVAWVEAIDRREADR